MKLAVRARPIDSTTAAASARPLIGRLSVPSENLVPQTAALNAFGGHRRHTTYDRFAAARTPTIPRGIFGCLPLDAVAASPADQISAAQLGFFSTLELVGRKPICVLKLVSRVG